MVSPVSSPYRLFPSQNCMKSSNARKQASRFAGLRRQSTDFADFDLPSACRQDYSDIRGRIFARDFWKDYVTTRRTIDQRFSLGAVGDSGWIRRTPSKQTQQEDQVTTTGRLHATRRDSNVVGKDHQRQQPHQQRRHVLT